MIEHNHETFNTEENEITERVDEVPEEKEINRRNYLFKPGSYNIKNKTMTKINNVA